MKIYRKIALALVLGTAMMISGLSSSAAFSAPIESSEAPDYPEFIYHDDQTSIDTYTVSEDMIIENESFHATVSPRTIIGADTRTQVTNVNADPFRHYVYIVARFEDNWVGEGTGFLIGNKTVVTAAHCINNYEAGLGKAISITVYPGGPSSQYGSTTAKTVFVNKGWDINSGEDRSYDYAVLELRDSFDIGYMNLDSVTNSELSSMKNRADNLYTFGFPCDKTSGTLWCSTGTILGYNTNFIYNYVDIVEGNSGGPLVTLDDRNTALGICITEDTTYNTFLRFNSANLDLIRSWRNECES